jgi:hypothetical protein
MIVCVLAVMISNLLSIVHFNSSNNKHNNLFQNSYQVNVTTQIVPRRRKAPHCKAMRKKYFYVNWLTSRFRFFREFYETINRDFQTCNFLTSFFTSYDLND